MLAAALVQWPTISRALGGNLSLHYLSHLVWLGAGMLFGEGVHRLLVRTPGRHAAGTLRR